MLRAVQREGILLCKYEFENHELSYINYEMCSDKIGTNFPEGIPSKQRIYQQLKL
jgi:hypothetical protein